MSITNDKVFERLEGRPKEFVNAFIDIFMERLHRRTPKVTGKLDSGWTVIHFTDGSVRIFNPVSYARFVEEGTEKMKPHRMLRLTAEEAEQIAAEALKRIK